MRWGCYNFVDLALRVVGIIHLARSQDVLTQIFQDRPLPELVQHVRMTGWERFYTGGVGQAPVV